MRPVAPEEQAALGAQANDRTRTHRLAVGAYVDHRARLDRVIAEVVLLIARTAECVLAFLIVALVEHEECFGHLRSLYPGPIRQPEDLPHSEFYRSEEHTSELQSLMRISYAVFCLKKKK